VTTVSRRLIVTALLLGWSQVAAALSFTLTVSRVEHNVKVDETLFVKPGGDR
jgi:hypothetical protein